MYMFKVLGLRLHVGIILIYRNFERILFGKNTTMCVVLCCAMLSYLLCYVVLSCAKLCHVVLCCPTLCYVVLNCATCMLSNVVLC